MNWWNKFWATIEEALEGDYYISQDYTTKTILMPDNNPSEAPISPVVSSAPNPDTLVPWGPQKANYHNTRVLCDLSGLSIEKTIEINGVFYAPKDIICGCVYQESNFLNYYLEGPKTGQPVIHKNLNKDGSISSIDYGIVQINDWFHIAPHGTPFPSTDYVMANPQACVQFMIDMYKEGQLSQWDSYLHGGFRQWLVHTSPMWLLAE